LKVTEKEGGGTKLLGHLIIYNSTTLWERGNWTERYDMTRKIQIEKWVFIKFKNCNAKS